MVPWLPNHTICSCSLCVYCQQLLCMFQSLGAVLSDQAGVTRFGVFLGYLVLHLP